ncbi:MAG: zonular occludens toxin domain-containing protein, partial [Defluviitaleaceae bacterium]|nr:zonular occludens toxin domain-containing protein [Defluviitaleaceae bacterium]
PIFQLTPEILERYALANHEKGKESQTYVFIDECQLIFNTRDYAQSNRRAWLVFFTSHRHYGFEFFLITQHDRMIDRQIRALVEHEVKHKKINNRFWYLPVTVFLAVEYWYGQTPKVKMFHEFIIFRPSVAKMYNSYTLFDDLAKKYEKQQVGTDFNTSAAADADAPCKPDIEISTPEKPIEMAAVTDTEVGVGGPRRRGGDGCHPKTAFVRLGEMLHNFFTPTLANAPIKGNLAKKGNLTE